MRRHSKAVGFAALIIAGLGVWAARTSHALSVETVAQIDPMPMMVKARHLPALRWTDYSLVFAN